MDRKLRALLLAATVCFTASSSLAANQGTGNDLLNHCQEAERVLDNPRADGDMLKVGLCIGFVEGVKNSLLILGSRDGTPPVSCTPPTLTNGQAIRVVLKYLRANPEQLHESKFILTWLAFVTAYPCKP